MLFWTNLMTGVNLRSGTTYCQGYSKQSTHGSKPDIQSTERFLNMKLTEETISSETIYDGRIIKLRRDKVKLPNGAESYREIVVHRGAIAAVPLMDDGTIIMVRQFRQAAGRALLEIPAGTLEEDEDPAVCAERELQEEIGYRPDKLTLLFSSFLAPGYSSEMLHTYLAQDLVVSKSPNDEDEFIETVRIPLNEVVDLICSGDIQDAKSICGILMTERILKSQPA